MSPETPLISGSASPRIRRFRETVLYIVKVITSLWYFQGPKNSYRIFINDRPLKGNLTPNKLLRPS